MNKEISRSPPKHGFLLNFAKSPPISIDQLDFFSANPHSKDSINEGDDQVSLHSRDVPTSATEPLSIKHNYTPSSNSAQNRRSHAKKKSLDHHKDSVTHILNTPSTTTNAKAVNKSAQSRGMPRPSTSSHHNFLNSKEFAKFALSRVLPREIKKEKTVNWEHSPTHKLSKPGSVEKRSPKVVLKEESSQSKLLNHLQPKKQKVKLRASNLTYNDFSSLLEQSRLIHSFINSPQRRSNLQISLPSTKSTSNLRPLSTKHINHTTKNSWLQTSVDAHKGLENSGSKKRKESIPSEGAKSKERNKGTHSIASILNLRRDKKLSPDNNLRSWHPASNYHRKVASIGGAAQNSAYSFNASVNQSGITHGQAPQVIVTQEDRKNSNQRSSSTVKRNPHSSLKEEVRAEREEIETDEDEGVASKDINYKQLEEVQRNFDNLLDKYKMDIDNAQETYLMMKSIKHSYEAFISELLRKQQEQQQQPSNGRETPQAFLKREKELKLKCEILVNEKAILEEEVEFLRTENHRLHNMLNDTRKDDGSLGFDPEATAKPSSKVIRETSESSLTDRNDCPTKKTNSENEELKRAVMVQQNMITAMKKREAKMIQLLFAIRAQNFDVKNVYRDEIQKTLDYSDLTCLLAISSLNNVDSMKDSHEKDSEMDTSRKILSIQSVEMLGSNLLN